MKAAVWDTYVTRKDGKVMHFDIIVPADIQNPEIIYQFGKEYLASKGQEGQRLEAEECSFCHIESLPEEREKELLEKGYYIIEMEGCQ